MKLSFHGAAHNVTGSCHLLEVGEHRILVDCGLFQGSRELNEDNAIPFGFDERSIDFVLLTHAHLDHCGRLPLLVKRGFRGEIIATQATFELARLVILDSAKLQEEESRSRDAHARKQNQVAPNPLYTVIDAMDCIGRFGRAASYGHAIDICPGVRATFYNAGHILGSSSILIEGEDKNGVRRVLFSGDIGSATPHILRPPEVPVSADAVVMETTYGDRLHRPFDESVKQFYQVVNSALSGGGNIVIPTFALERAQEILFFLRQGVDENRLPPSLQVYLDSPMAISATQIFERHLDDFTPAVREMLAKGQDPFSIPGLHLTRDKAESIAINNSRGGAIIMAGSGMCTGGRIRHHLVHNLPRSEASIVFVGYAANGTLARQIIDGAKEVQIFGERVAVRAEIHTINGFSAHADQNELLAWQERIANKRIIALVHGEPSSMEAFAARLTGRVVMPKLNDEINLD
ncbi:MAG TPA: MBL fold metallo-hydrolase [Rhizomicrobium sp.]|nr:MBL fold metallo-hydrolase [Rhizomicrobium sp.]